MCGFLAYYSITEIDDQKFKNACSKLNHRGPDSEGYWFSDDKKKAFGFKRLSIIDPNPDSDQPMFDEKKENLILFNGEIYNYLEIKEELLNLGVKFRTKSDTEVILEGYKKFGIVDLHKRLRGMFSILIFDLKKNTTYILRDLSGMKPLYFTQSNNEIIISSEIKSIIKLNEKISITSKQYNHFLNTGGIMNKITSTLFSNVYSVDQGEIIEIFNENQSLKMKQIKKFTYNNLVSKDEYNKIKNKSFSEQCRDLKKILYDSVEENLVSDVPLGIMFSSGIDSALIAKIACDISKKKLFLFKYDSKLKESLNDNLIAEEFANNNNCELVKTFLDENEILIDIPKNIYFYEGINKPDSTALSSCTKKAKELGYKVLLSGDCADELFLGYQKHIEYYFKKKITSGKIFNNLKKMINVLIPNNNNFEDQDFNHLLLNEEREIIAFILDSLLFSSTRGHNLNLNLKTYKFEKNKALSLTSGLMLDEIIFFLKRFLIRSDIYGMRNGVEIRIPFLDKRNIQYCLNTPPNQKIKFEFKMNKKVLPTFRGKQHLKEIARMINLPKKIIDKNKTGTSLNLKNSLFKIFPLFSYKNYSDHFSCAEQDLKNSIDFKKPFAWYNIYNIFCTEIFLRIYKEKIHYKSIQEEIRSLLN